MFGSGTSSSTTLLPLSLLKRYSSSKKTSIFVTNIDCSSGGGGRGLKVVS